jgi:alkanesulfonate monooxygenase SsuD/methylene tetrahydromethanopterin reductase-like flavin-dependent oxidoreductase (luciferase family)
MRLGVALAQTDWPDAGSTWSFGQMAEYGIRAERAGFDSAWCNDHVFLQFGDAPRRLALPDPMVLLSYLAGRTERIELGTLVIGAPFRSPVQLAREARTLHDVSSGRFVLGLGAGWHEPELEAIGAPTDRLVSRFEEYAEALIALLRGDGPVDYDGRYVRLRGAQVSGEGSPPIWIGASGPRMLALTGRLADGWNMPASLRSLAELLATVRREEAAAGRPEGSVVVSTGASVLLVDEEEGERLLAEHPPRAGSSVAVGADGLRQVVERHGAAGCDHLILHFSGAIWSSYGPEQLDLASEALSLDARP